MTPCRFGIVGTGMIAAVVADALAGAERAVLTRVASRSRDRAAAFIADRPQTEHPAAEPVEGWQALIAGEAVDAVYVATPTVAKEEIALAAIAAGKHVLVDKPFLDAASAQRMADAAAAAGRVFMDATHFVHHPRTLAVREATAERLGATRALHGAFHFPMPDDGNIRLDPAQEPTGALGDMGWYPVRALVTYLRPEGRLTTVAATGERHPDTGALVHVHAFLGFEDGRSASFDAGFTTGTALMDLQLLGRTGVVGMDDFVLDWTNSFLFGNPEIETGYTYRTGVMTRAETQFVRTPSATPQQVLMCDAFAAKAAGETNAAPAARPEDTVATQRLLDAVWEAVK